MTCHKILKDLTLAAILLAAMPLSLSGSSFAQDVDPAELVKDIHAIFGDHHARAVHAKGIVLEATFEPTGEAHALSKALVFTSKAESSSVLSSRQQDLVADSLEQNAEVMTNTDLEELLKGRRPRVQEEILRINTEARPVALQIALLVPLIAGLLGLLTAFRMTKLPDPELSEAAETVLGG